VIVGAFVVAAVLTPPDVISQLMMAIPLCLLFELGLFLARFVRKRQQAAADQNRCSGTAQGADEPMSAAEMETAIEQRARQPAADTERKPEA
jgi:sec-independent protein translocase protein TatC